MNNWNNNDYILLKGYASHEILNLENYKHLRSSHLVDVHEGLMVMSLSEQHTIHEFMEAHTTKILNMIETKFNFKNLYLRYNTNLMQYKHNHGIPLHNDWFEDNENNQSHAIVARGVLSLNPTYIFGTDMYSLKYTESYIGELGGHPGDLFIFKCSPDS